MILSNLDGGIHSVEDLRRKFTHTWVYARPNLDVPATCYISEMFDNVVIGIFYQDSRWIDFQCQITEFDLIRPRPEIGVYNLATRPALLEQSFTRQWKVGLCQDNMTLRSMNGMSILENEQIPFLYEPKYPTLSEALTLIKKGDKKHIAISNKYSIRQGISRSVLLYLFKPILVFNMGFTFPINDKVDMLSKSSDQLQRWKNEYANYWRNMSAGG
jgi:hypothetical protein